MKEFEKVYRELKAMWRAKTDEKICPDSFIVNIALTCVKVSTAPASAAGESFPELVGESNGADLKYFDVSSLTEIISSALPARTGR
jgi:hypothetical protein